MLLPSKTARPQSRGGYASFTKRSLGASSNPTLRGFPQNPGAHGGAVWSAPAITSSSWYGICWSPELSLFCTVAHTGANQVATSPDGVTWTVRTASLSSQWVNVCWSPELRLFCAISQNSQSLMTSPDGINWTTRTGAASKDWVGICWSPDLRMFVATARTGTQLIQTSRDGINWSLQTSVLADIWGVCWSPELRLFCGVGGSGRVVISKDGVTWTGSTPWSLQAMSVCWSPERRLFVAPAYNNSANTNNILTSPDGINWTVRSSGAIKAWRGICWSAELRLFAVIGDNPSSVQGTSAATSTDGRNWRVQTVPTAYKRNICSAPKLRMVCAASETANMYVGRKF